MADYYGYAFIFIFIKLCLSTHNCMYRFSKSSYVYEFAILDMSWLQAVIENLVAKVRSSLLVKIILSFWLDWSFHPSQCKYVTACSPCYLVVFWKKINYFLLFELSLNGKVKLVTLNIFLLEATYEIRHIGYASVRPIVHVD